MQNLTVRADRRIKGRPTNFRKSRKVVSAKQATGIVKAALAKWEAPSQDAATKWRDQLARKFPDQYGPISHWDEAAGIPWNEFFTWGHDHNFGHGVTRPGAMATRHIEITTDAIAMGMLPRSLKGKRVLDIGCWTGGDLLVFAGMGAAVTAIEQHPISTAAAKQLCKLVGYPADIHCMNVYKDKPEWKNSFDYVYCSGVSYHVTDPLLLLRICFAYLKVGGTLIVETKASASEQSLCTYSGSSEKGWNWYAPSMGALGRWFSDAGFDFPDIHLFRRNNGRLLGTATKSRRAKMPDHSGFSRPGSWLEGNV